MSILQTNALSKFYGSVRGIENLDMSVEEGEIFGFIGPNGAGKSTAIRTLLTLIFPTSGSATIFGKDIVEDAKAIKQHIGYLPSDVHFYDNMKVRELMEYSAKLYGVKLDQRFNDLVDRFELNLNRQLKDLSTGNKKKVGVVLALLHRPQMLILDEPTSGLDPLMQQVFFEVLREENANGTTIFFSSHILSEVQHLCERVAVIRDGQIVATEMISELRKKQLKKCRVEMKEQPSAEQFTLPGIENLQLQNHSATFNFAGRPNELMAMLNNHNLQDVRIEEPPLEEVFMKYYQEKPANDSSNE